LYAESAHRPLNSFYYKFIGKHFSNEYFKALFSGWLAALGDGQKSIHQWQICWWYESIMLPVKDRLSLIISLKIAQMTSVRHEMWSYVCLSVHRWFTVAHAASLWLCWLSSYRLKLTTTSRGAGESIRGSVRRFNWFYFESHA